jgi:tetratricopeptide (TPR) repeat protein
MLLYFCYIGRLVLFAVPVLLVAFTTARAAKAVDPDKPLITEMLNTGHFEALDAKLTGYERQFEQDHTLHRLPEIAFSAFANSDQMLQTSLDQWVAKTPDSYAAHLARGIYLEHLGWTARGAALSSKTAPEAFTTQKAFFARAKPDLEQALAMNSEVIMAYRYLGVLEAESGTRARGLRLLENGLAHYPESAMLHERLLQELEPKWGGSFADIEAYTQANASRFGTNDDLRALFATYEDYAKADDALVRRQPSMAATYLDRIIGIYPRASYLMLRSQAAFRQYRYDEAMDFAQRALTLEPQDPSIIGEVGLDQLNQHHFEEAVVTLSNAIGLDRLNSDYLLDRAIAFRYLGRRSDAARDVDDANLFGQYDPAVQIERSRDLVDVEGRLDDAITAARLATQLDPGNADAWLRLVGGLWAKRDCDATTAISNYKAICMAARDCAEGQEFLQPTIVAELMSTCH